MSNKFPPFYTDEIPLDYELEEVYFEICGDTRLDFYDDNELVLSILESSLDTI
jgi:hypothetical protein